MELSYSQITEVLMQKDEVLKKVIQQTNNHIQPTPNIDIYAYLLQAIVSQQLSIKVADIIWKRFEDLFVDANPEPRLLLAVDNQRLRDVGLSRQKLTYLKNVAQFALDNNLSFEVLAVLDDKEIIDLLTQIKGVGKWTVQMVLMFPLDRLDVFPVDDLGIQTKMKKWYDLTSDKSALKKEMRSIAERWRPYRSLASKYLWSSP